jgi:hypothetical protein
VGQQRYASLVKHLQVSKKEISEVIAAYEKVAEAPQPS